MNKEKRDAIKDKQLGVAMEADLLARVHRAARFAGFPASTYARMLLIEKVEEIEKRMAATTAA